jgi:predicted tellurium resistance membrane protein TerC
MSMDNVIAIAAAANSAASTPDLENMKYVLLVLGLAISIPIVIFGSVMMLKVMERFPIIIALGAALLGWRVAPIAGAVLVTACGRWSRREIKAPGTP